jgi:purine-cytosine permease-like protein
MMAVFGVHSGYILASYAAGILILGWMIVGTWLESHKQ